MTWLPRRGPGSPSPRILSTWGKDDGLDKETGRKAEEHVKAWRRAGQLPFPRFAPERLERVDGTLDYPPRGSPEAGMEDFEATTRGERLSAESPPDEELTDERSEQEDSGTRRPETE
jgi:MscS family membrane protein